MSIYGLKIIPIATRRGALHLLFFAGVLLPGQTWPDEADLFEFFAQEATVVTAARQPQPLHRAPATVYVVTARDIETSGAQTLWDALRGVPGVEVMTTRTLHGEVSIRGLNKPLNNRTLVLLDGKTVLNGFWDFVTWENIPVTLEEIDRIEVVEGPVSALYGTNALNGVINIITKIPEQLQGGKLNYSVGERETHLGSLLYGNRRGRTRYKLGLGWRSANRFENPDLSASKVFKIHGFMGRDLATESRLGLTAGLARLRTQLTTGPPGTGFDDGGTGFARIDFQHRDIQVRSFWNRGRTTLRNFSSLNEPNMHYDTYDVDVQHSVALSPRHRLIAGGNYRRNTMRSRLFQESPISQNLWAVFFEHEWRAGRDLTLVGGSRLDRHPLSGRVFSPRASAIFSPNPQHVLRFSTGTAFRNPTLTENYGDFQQRGPIPGALADTLLQIMELRILGNGDLESEQILFFEIAHSGRFDRLQIRAAAFHYRLRDIITGIATGVAVEAPALIVDTTVDNVGETRAWGGEVGAELSVDPRLVLFLNYAHLRLRGEIDLLSEERGGPAHKVNGGFRARTGHLTFNLWTHWVDETSWSRHLLFNPTIGYAKVDSYALVNAWVGYEFSDRLRGLNLALSAFNLLDREHFQILPSLGENEPGQNGEILRRRLTATISYRL